jgi:hypothetical protein
VAQFINLNNTHIINISEIQSVEFKEEEIGRLLGVCGLSKRYTQKTGRTIKVGESIALPGNYHIVIIELKSGHKITIKDFDLKDLKEYIFSQLENVTNFECAEVRYSAPGSYITIGGDLDVKADLNYSGDYPVPLTIDSNR